MAELMRAAHRSLPREIDGEYRYSDPWFRAYIRRIFGDDLGLPTEALGDVTEELFARFEDPATFRAFPGARDLVDDLRARGLFLGVISNGSARLPRVLVAMQLADAFDVVLCSALERLEKPDPAIFRLALERAGVDPSAALHAGDHPKKDVAAARTAGMHAALVDHFGTCPAEAVGAGTPIAKSLPELHRHILELLG
jgi:HAD superfamily hydrolase (TIGR01549 family)